MVRCRNAEVCLGWWDVGGYVWVVRCFGLWDVWFMFAMVRLGSFFVSNQVLVHKQS